MDLSELERLTKQNAVADMLRRAKALIDRPEKWCQGGFSDGIRFCMFGAARKVMGEPLRGAASDLSKEYQRVSDCLNAVTRGAGVFFNDSPHTSHADVLSAFDRAIALSDGQA